MAGENVLNAFLQPNSSAPKDNVLRLQGTVTGKNGTQAANVADATDLATAITLVNALKAIAIDTGTMAPNP